MQRRLFAPTTALTAAIQSWLSSLRTLVPIEALTYRPELHYMRGPRHR